MASAVLLSGSFPVTLRAKQRATTANNILPNISKVLHLLNSNPSSLRTACFLYYGNRGSTFSRKRDESKVVKTADESSKDEQMTGSSNRQHMWGP